MSHVTDISVDMTDQAALKEAAVMIGLEVIEKDTYHWWGTHVGDFPLPEGFTAAELGKCEFAFAVKGEPTAYEVGVVKRRDGKPGYTFLFDFYGANGQKLEKVIGHRGSKLMGPELKREYTAAVTAQQLRMKGYRVIRENDENGNINMMGVRA